MSFSHLECIADQCPPGNNQQQSCSVSRIIYEEALSLSGEQMAQ